MARRRVLLPVVAVVGHDEAPLRLILPMRSGVLSRE